jgi:uncharacterized protein YdhG (YjbR/CyaY superfamily)
MKKKAKPVATVDEYLQKLDPPVKQALEKLRQLIKKLLPNAEEVISYQIPTYRLNGPVAAFAAFPNHCSYYTMSHAVMKSLKEELRDYDCSGVTIHFQPAKPLPLSLVKKLVAEKLKENKTRISAKKTATKAIASKTQRQSTDEEQVNKYMEALSHPLKKEIEAVRKIIKGCDRRINERIKWNAPSYYTSADMVTFNPRAQQYVHLVFHHPAIVKIKSTLLEGEYKDRRMVYFADMKAVNKNKKELQRIMKELVKLVES